MAESTSLLTGPEFDPADRGGTNGAGPGDAARGPLGRRNCAFGTRAGLECAGARIYECSSMSAVIGGKVLTLGIRPDGTYAM
jgi:hypothetical protein